MINPGKQINVTQLDFDQIKQNMIDYFKNSETGFTDWDFEGSNLNTLIDVLAYNTHYNAMLAHAAVNESFIDSAQLRGSVVSAVKLLGYIPRSKTASKAQIAISFEKNPDYTGPSTIECVRGSTLTLSKDADSFVFCFLQDSKLTLNTETNRFENIEPVNVYEGALVTRTYRANAADPTAVYEIIDSDIDVSSLVVSVYDTTNPESAKRVFSQYTNSNQVAGDSLVYFINENSFGKYEIGFGDNVFGKKLDSGNIIEFQYLVTNAATANRCSTLVASNIQLNNPTAVLNTQQGISIVSRSSGGQEKESISSIKNNAISNFSTQNRAVTSDDYSNLIKSRFGYINSISVWGGEDNIPPVYGKVFISANKKNQDNSIVNLDNSDKGEILGYLKDKKVLSIFPEIIDPQNCKIVLDILVKFNPNISSLNRADITNAILSVISDYNQNRINEFNSIFRHSQFVRAVENSASSILNSLVRVYLMQELEIKESEINNVKLDFGARCATDDGKAIVSVYSSNPWTANGKSIFIGEEQTSDKNVINLYSYFIENGVQIRLDSVGSFNIKTGIMNLSNLVTDSDVTLKIIVNSYSNDIVSTRNSLLHIDSAMSTVNVFADEIARGGNNRSIEYTTFPKDR